MATWREVSRVALALPGVIEERSARGQYSWKVNKKGFAWERPLRPADLAALGDAAPSGAILGVRTADLEMKEVLLVSDPAVFFTTPHFDGYPAVLIRLDAIAAKELERIVLEAWLARAPDRVVKAYLSEQSGPGRRRTRQTASS